jgi:type II secretory pathway component PulJ
MSPRHVLAALALASSLALAACGSEDQQSTQAAAGQEQEATPAQARTEIAAVRTALENAVAAMGDGDAAKAEQLVSEGYLQHFEKVEGPLGKVDHDLTEKLEESIREQLRDKIKGGGSTAEIKTMVTAIKADLATAEQKLQ